MSGKVPKDYVARYLTDLEFDEVGYVMFKSLVCDSEYNLFVHDGAKVLPERRGLHRVKVKNLRDGLFADLSTESPESDMPRIVSTIHLVNYQRVTELEV